MISLLIIMVNHIRETYRGVDGLVAFHVTILTCAMMGLAEGDAWQTAGDGAEVDRGKASEESSEPWTRISWGRSSDLGAIGEDCVESFSPILHVPWVPGTRLTTGNGGSGLWLLLGVHVGGEEERRNYEVKKLNIKWYIGVSLKNRRDYDCCKDWSWIERQKRKAVHEAVGASSYRLEYWVGTLILS